MATSIVRATKAKVDIAGITVDGLMMPSGEYRMSDADIARAVGTNPKNALSHFRRDALKKLPPQNAAAAGVNPLVSLCSASPQKIKVAGLNQKFNSSTIEFASVYWASLGTSNQKAFALTVALATETIQRRFDRAFDQQVTESEYDAQLALRLKRLNARHEWTDTIRDRMVEYGYYDNKRRVAAEFRELTIDVNMALFNQPHFCCDRDTMTPKQQQLISEFESAAQRQALKHPNATPSEIVERALMLF